MRTLAVGAIVAIFLSPMAHAEDYSAELSAISLNESGGGIYKEHKVMTSGMHKGCKAGGSWGMMPLTAKDVIRTNSVLKKKYGYLLGYSNDLVTNALNTNGTLDLDIATAHWKSLRGKLDRYRAAYAWLNGSKWAGSVPKKTILDHYYVQRFSRGYIDKVIHASRK